MPSRLSLFFLALSAILWIIILLDDRRIINLSKNKGGVIYCRMAMAINAYRGENIPLIKSYDVKELLIRYLWFILVFSLQIRLMLILAGGDKDRKKNLTLRDIFANLKIPNARAAVLSACETGMVKLESGDEYIGLASGFMYAGSPTVISSLWSVDDLHTFCNIPCLSVIQNDTSSCNTSQCNCFSLAGVRYQFERIYE